ncbi:MAG: NAD(P)-dependent oxidoreductase [Candidatus Paceibacterota bacterium]|jgi:D-lactate dehydrogenase
MKISFFGVKESERGYLEASTQKSYPNDEASLYNESLNIEHIPADTSADIISVFVGCTVNKEVIEKFPNLKLIVARSTGYDNIDLDECKKRNIVVCNVPSYGENTVAEQAFALLLILSRKMIEAVERVRATKNFSTDGLTGFDLKGKTLGVLGTGRIGIHSIKIAKGFEMNVIAYDVFQKQELQSQLGFTYRTFDEVLAESDIITVHVPYMKETHHLLNAHAFTIMKPSTYIINTSRGAVVDTGAMFQALKNNKIAGAGLDVMEDESVMNEEERQMLAMPNVVITPHNAFNTEEAIERILETTIQNISAFLKDTPQNIVK